MFMVDITLCKGMLMVIIWPTNTNKNDILSNNHLRATILLSIHNNLFIYIFCIQLWSEKNSSIISL